MMNDTLLHFGIKGMKWGIRKERTHNPRDKATGYKIYKNGRIEIEPGVEMQRLVTSGTVKDMSRSLNGYAFMSFLPNDNAQYINTMAPQSKIKELKRDTILTLRTKQKLKSPSVEEAQKITVDLMRKYADELEAYRTSTKKNKSWDRDVSDEAKAYNNVIENYPFDAYARNHKMTPAMKRELKEWDKNIRSVEHFPILHPDKYPTMMYSIANGNIGYDSPSSHIFTKELLGAIESKGYNMIRDENDATSISGRWKAPVIVIKPENNVEVALSKKISRMKLWQAQRYVEKGKRQMERMGQV